MSDAAGAAASVGLRVLAVEGAVLDGALRPGPLLLRCSVEGNLLAADPVDLAIAHDLRAPFVIPGLGMLQFVLGACARKVTKLYNNNRHRRTSSAIVHHH